MGELITLTLQELLSSTCLSKSIFSFAEDVDLSEVSGSFKKIEPDKDQLRHLNAAKISLLLAKSFRDRCSSGSISEIEKKSLEKIHPRDIFVQLKCCSDLNARCCSEEPNDATGVESDAPPSVSPPYARYEHESPPSSDSSFGVALEEIFSEQADGANQVGEMKTLTREVSQTSNISDWGTQSDINNEQLGRSKGNIRIPVSNVMHFRTIDQDNMCNLHCTLISAGIVGDQSNDVSTSQSSKVSHTQSVCSLSAGIRILGKLIHTVFSNDAQPLPIESPDAISSEVDDAGSTSDSDTSFLPRVSKYRRSNDSALFSSLVDSGHYPIAICRLLSDMMDAEADAPFATFDEVIHDIEQMSLHPEIFLHDLDAASCSSPSLLFGERYYGRASEVTKMLEISTRLEQLAQNGSDQGSMETVYISGSAGSGKTHLARRVGNFLSQGAGWIVLEAKFDRCTDHQSLEVIILLFDKLISRLVDMMRGSIQEDVDYSERAAQSISNAFDSETLPALANFAPSIHNLIDGIDDNSNRDKKHSPYFGGESSHWKLIVLISRLLGALLKLDRFIMICCDDLQWCDSQILTLINETIFSIAHDGERRRLLFVGTYRHNEIDDSSPLMANLSHLQRNKSVNVTELNLSSLTINDISEMVSNEMRLPRRLVSDLAHVVHKKTSGHALFVVELLNSLLRDATVAYSPLKRRYDWDPDKVSRLKTGNDVASLIISKITSLKPAILRTLSVLSCFGFKTEISLLRLLQESSILLGGGFNLESLVEEGILEISGSVIVFTHDLVQKHVYEILSKHQRQKLHCDIGTFLATKTNLDSSLAYKPIDDGMEQLYICHGDDTEDDGSSNSVLSLAGIATSQINKAGLEFISDRTRRIRFAGWNMRSANESREKSNFHAALYYCKNGLSFLSDNLWHIETCQLSLELHEAAASASIAVGNAEGVAQYANAIIDGPLEFEKSLVAQNLLIRSLETQGLYTECIARGLAVLRQLNFDIPTAPTPEVVLQAMAQTTNIASQYNFDHISDRPEVIHQKQRNALRIIDSVAVACYLSTSPYLPLVACSTVIYSLQHGIFHCEESVSSFVIFGYFKVYLKQNLDEGHKWGKLAHRMLETSRGYASVRARMYLYGFLLFWFIPIKESCLRLYETYAIGMRCGDVGSAMYSLFFAWVCQFYGGEKLSIVKANYKEYMKSIAKYSEDVSKKLVLRKVNLNELMGISDDNPYSVLEGAFWDIDGLLFDAKSKGDIHLIEAVNMSKFLSAFWRGDFLKAMEFSNELMSLPSSKMPKLHLIYHTFYRGIVAFRLFREGNGVSLLKDGEDVLSTVKAWSETCKWTENKALLIEAEYLASKCKRNLAKEKYEASIQSARDHGFLHEQGLAYECMGKYFSSIIELPEGRRCFREAHRCYMQWGALGKAEQIHREQGLDVTDVNGNQSVSKHEREEGLV